MKFLIFERYEKTKKKFKILALGILKEEKVNYVGLDEKAKTL